MIIVWPLPFSCSKLECRVRFTKENEEGFNRVSETVYIKSDRVAAI